MSAGEQPVRIAMWSGPRNISTAMMRSWGSRPDTFVCDEPLYAHYLSRVPAPHPGAEEVIEHHETDWRKVVSWLTGDVPEGRRIFYQKHMAHHLLPEIERDWLDRLTNVLLIRDPREVLLSLGRKLPRIELRDTGFAEQEEIFERESERLGHPPPVIDARDVLERPRETLTALCAAAGVPFDERMLSWEPGPRPTDGIWARHWYHEVNRSTGFAPYRPREGRLDPALDPLHERCRAIYDRLHRHRLRGGGGET